MHVNMALEAVRELLEHHLAMGLAVAFLALRNVSVPCVALCAGNLAVLARGCPDLFVHRSVACTADIVLRRLRVRYLQRIMHRVAGQTFFNSLPL